MFAIALAAFIVLVGVFAWALCNVAGRADEDMERSMRVLRGGKDDTDV